MAVINVYEQYFEAEGCFREVERRGALVMLTADSEAGQICYEAAVTLFPHRDEEDYAVSYDAFFSKVLYEAKGRRSRKREQELLNGLQQQIDELLSDQNAKVHWDQPLREARFG